MVTTSLEKLHSVQGSNGTAIAIVETYVTDTVVSALTVLVTTVPDTTVVITVVVWRTVVMAVDGFGVTVLV